MVKCSARNCDSVDIYETDFFKFPSEKDWLRRGQWLKHAGLESVPLPPGAALCPHHFAPQCFKGSVLLPDAVPTIFLETSEDIAITKKKVVGSEIRILTKLTNIGINSLWEQAANNSNERPPVNTAPTATGIVPEAELPPDEAVADVMDFEEEIDRLKDPLGPTGKPATKRRDEDVRTKFTDEDDLPLVTFLPKRPNPNYFLLPYNTLPINISPVVIFFPSVESQSVPDSINNSSLPSETPPVITLEDSDDDNCILGDVPESNYVLRVISTEQPEEILSEVNPLRVLEVELDGAHKENSNRESFNFPKQEDIQSSQSYVANVTLINPKQSNAPNIKGDSCIFLCSSCDYYASSEELLRIHEQEGHKTMKISEQYPFKILISASGNKTYMCDYCSIQVSDMNNLMAHMLIHFPKQEIPDSKCTVRQYQATVSVQGKKEVVNMPKFIIKLTLRNTDMQKVTTDEPDLIDLSESDDLVGNEDSLGNIMITNVMGGVENLDDLLVTGNSDLKKSSRVAKAKRGRIK